MTKRILFKCIPILFGIFMYAMPKVGYSQVGNIAPQATITGDGTGGGGCRPVGAVPAGCGSLNDLVLGTCGAQSMWISTATPPTLARGGDYIQWDFPNPVSFDTIVIHHAEVASRFLTGATIQYWDGAAWVDHFTFSGLPQVCVNRIPIGRLTTDRFRMTSWVPGTGQQSNMNFREIEIIAAPSGSNDAAVLSVDSPRVFCAGVENVIATIANLGVNQIDSVDVEWEVNGVAQPSVRYIGLLDTAAGTLPFRAQVNLGTFNFSAGTTNIRAWTSNPNGIADTSNFNDTVNTNVQTATPPPAAVVTAATLTTANATLGNANGIDYVVVPFGAPVTSGTVVANVSSPFTATGLTASTTYDLYVRKNCGASNVSAWVGPTTFNTAYAVPFFQDFENLAPGLFGNSFPEGWSQRPGSAGFNRWESEDANNGNNENSGGTGPLWDHTFFGGPTNGMYMFMETSTSTTGDTVDLYSPPILIDSVLTTVELGYWYFNHGANIDKMEVLVDTNGVENLIASYTGQQQPNQTDPWLFDSHFLNGYNGQSITLIFRGYGVPCCSGDIAVDDISIDPVLPLDAGITDVIAPSGSLCPGTVTPIVEVRNYGSNQIDSVKVLWDVNGVLDSINYIGTIAPGARVPVTLGTLNINATTVYNITFSTKDPNGAMDMFPNNDDLTVNGLRTGLNGTVTVDPALPASASNFVDFASLSAAINTYGVCGAATVNVANGVYNESLLLSNIPGASATNTLTIDGGDSSLTTLVHDGTTNLGTITLDNANYVTIRNIGARHTGTNGAAILVAGNSDYNTFSNNDLRVNVNTTTSLVSCITFTSNAGSSTAIPSDGDYNLISNNKMIGGYYGVRLYGNTTIINTNNRVIENDIDSVYYYGVWAYYQDSTDVIGNRIVQTNRGNAFGDGIYGFVNNNFRINSNYVLADDYGVYTSNSNASTRPLGRVNEVINNMIISNTDFGLYFFSVDSVNMYHNSIVGLGASPTVYISANTTYNIDDYDVRNNIFYSATAEAWEMLNVPKSDTIFTKFDNNCYYTGGTTLFNINATTYNDLNAYRTGRPLFNSAAIEGDPQFLSLTDLHIIGGFVNDTGDNTVNVLIDIDGDVRPFTGSTVVDLGADEFDPPTCVPVVNASSFGPTLTSINLTWTGTAGSYQYEVVLAGSPQGSGTPALTTSDTVTVTGLTASTQYQYYVRQICGRGDTSLWLGPYDFGTANGVPYLQDFENFGTNLTGLINVEGWTTNGTATPHWESGTSTSSFGTGPTADHTIGAGGTFVYLETSGGTTGDDDTLYSPPIYFDPSQTAVTLEFWYHMHGAAMGTLEVFADTNGVLIPLPTVTQVGQQQAAQGDPWLSTTAVLGGLQDKSVVLKFVGIRGTSFTSDMAVDDVRLFIPAAADGGVTAVVRPGTGCGLTAADSVEVTITNFGTGAISNFPVSYVLNSGTPVTETFTGTIPAGLTANYTFNTTANLAAFGSYNLTSYTSVPSDGDLTNDTITVSFDNIPQVSYPYFEDFETTNGGWTVDGANASWAWGAPTGTYINAAAAGTNAWVTNLSGQYNNNEQSYIVSPCIDLSGQTQDVTIYFDHIFETETSFDEGWLEESTNGGQTWTKVLGNAAQNWYNNTANQYWETANTSGSQVWDSATTVLTGSATQANYRLRFVFSSDGSVTREGFGVDNFAIGITTGLDEESTALVNGFNVSPNPSKGLFTLRLESEKIENLNVTVRDLDGKKVYEDNISVNGTYREDIDLTNLAKGVYFMQVMSGEETRVEKLVIQ